MVYTESHDLMFLGAGGGVNWCHLIKYVSSFLSQEIRVGKKKSRCVNPIGNVDDLDQSKPSVTGSWSFKVTRY